MAIVEPVFGNLRSNKQLNRFTYLGQAKVNVQWNLSCLVYHFAKLTHFGSQYGKKNHIEVTRGKEIILPISPHQGK